MKPGGEASCPILRVHPHSQMFFVDDSGRERLCCETEAAWVGPRLHQTTNLGVGGSNPSGRATYTIGSAQSIFMIGFYP